MYTIVSMYHLPLHSLSFSENKLGRRFRLGRDKWAGWATRPSWWRWSPCWTSWYVLSREGRQFVRSLNICNSQVGSVKDLVTKLTTCLEDVETVNRDGNIVTFTVPRFKQRITVVVPDFNSIQSVLDVCKVITLSVLLYQH